MNNSCDLFPFDLGDQRLDRRAGRIVQAALEPTGDSIPTAGNLAATEATYRFLDNPNVVPSDLDDAHTQATVDLAARYPGVLLIAQDTSDADLTSPARNGRLGQLAHAKHFGFFVHSALALTADGLPLGLLHQHVWMRRPDERGKRKDRRRKETADKESQRWLDTEAACLAALPADRTVVMIADRECDFYDYFAVARRPGQHVLIRAKLRRRIAGSKELLGAATRAGPVQGTLCVPIPRQDGQPERQAMRLIGRLGGFLAQGDGEPGVKVLWRGLRQLQAMVIGFRLAKAVAHGVQSSDE